MPSSANMQSLLFRMLLNTLLALSIFLAASMGRLLGIQTLPLNLSPVWPATGFSLAALMILGNRAWPGIFIGNFCYNFLHLYLAQMEFLAPFIAALLITLGSVIQALVGNSIIRRYSTAGYFDTVKNCIVFLIGGGLITCTIAATVACVTLSLYGALKPNDVEITWLTMWLGDSMGVYIFTPLLVKWLMSPLKAWAGKHPIETVSQLVCLIALSFLFMMATKYPAIYLFVPYSLWITYRFRIHGETVAVFLISLITILGTVLGYGSFILSYPASPFLALVSFLQLIVMINMILGAVMTERDAAWNLVQMRDLTISEAVRIHLSEIQAMGPEMVHKEKLSTLTSLLSAMSNRVKAQLKTMTSLTDKCLEYVTIIRQSEASPKAVCNSLEQSLHTIEAIEGMTSRLVTHMALCTPEKARMTPTNINQLVEHCINDLLKHFAEQKPPFTPHFKKELSTSIEKIYALPEDLEEAVCYYLYQVLLLMYKKQKALQTSYKPILEIRSLDRGGRLEIELRCNGILGPKPDLTFYFQSLSQTQVTEEIVDLDGAIAHDTIVLLHGGELNVSLLPNDFLQITLIIPKPDFLKSKDL